MALRGNEMVKKILKKVGQSHLVPKVEESLEKWKPDNKVIMGRAKRGLYGGHHIRFGNRVSEDGGNKSRRTWKPNVQGKRLFSYVLDRHIRVKVTTHALRCIDKAGGIDEYLLKTPYHKLDTEMGLFWKAKIEKLYQELGKVEASEDEAKLELSFKDLKLSKEEAHRQFRKHKQIEEGGADNQETDESKARSRVPASYIICSHDLKEKGIVVNH